MKITINKVGNPYSIFVIAWSLCIFLYSLGWAGIYPKLTYQLLIFLAGFIILFAVTSVLYNKVKGSFVNLTPIFLNYRLLLIIISFLWIITFMHSGIPILNGTKDDDFGITGIKNILTSLNNFISVYCFYLYLITGRRKFIFYAFYCLTFYILSFSRGNIMMTCLTMFFVWMNLNTSFISLKKISIIFVSALFALYLFGVAGNIRSINFLSNNNPNFDKTYNSNIILEIGDASNFFKENIPGEYFWTYAYITSPISNLQYNIDLKNSPGFSLNGMILLFNNEIVLDMFSTKINNIIGFEKKMPEQIVDGLAVSTALSGSYLDAGWLGMFFFMMFLWAFPIVYILLVFKNPLGIIGISTLCTVYFFSIFDNMFILTGLTLQLIYPLIWSVSKRLIRKSKATDSARLSVI